MDKICSKCKQEKDISKFYRRTKESKDSHTSQCKLCSDKKHKEWVIQNKDKIAKHIRKYQQKNKKILREHKRIYEIKNKKIIALKAKKYNLLHKEHLYQLHKIWRQNNINKIHKLTNLLHKRKMKNDPNYKILKLLRSRLNHWVKDKKLESTNNLLGCTIEQLKQHLQETAISNGYKNFDINNYSGKEYHIDHIVPCKEFNVKCSYHQKLCFNWSNLQILTARENLKKRYKEIICQ